MSSYDRYVHDTKFLDGYNAYQERYAASIPERDKVMLKLIAGATRGRPARLLDIGCSTGNLLMHISRFFPQLELNGGELAESSLAVARQNPELDKVNLHTMDMLAITGTYDVIVANAVAVYFDWSEYEAAIRSVSNSLNPGGHYIAFEWLHPFEQDLMIVEESVTHPEGLTVYFRPQDRVRGIMEAAGFTDIRFHPFEISIDLPHPGHTGDVATYTVKAEDGRRLQFRGSLYQPWCHMVATRGLLPARPE